MTPRVYGADEPRYPAGGGALSLTHGRIGMKKVSLGNNVIAAMGKDDMWEAREASPITIISAMFDAGQVTLCTSDVTKEELDKWQGDKKPEVLQCYNRVSQVPRVERQELQGFHTYADRYGTFLAWPLLEDHPRWSKLWTVGLETFDAHHLMVAILANCDVFLTCDKRSFQSRRDRIAQEYPQIHSMWPSEALYCL